MQNIYFYVIVFFVVVFFIFDKFVDYLNTLNWSSKLPDDVREIYDEEKYTKFQEYEKAKYKFYNISDTFNFITIILVLVLMGIN